MKTAPAISLLLTAALLLAAATPAAAQDKTDPATILALKRAAERYALTKTRIATLLDKRMNPAPLAPSPPNPFYRAPDLPVADSSRPGAPGLPGGLPESTVPAEADESDAGTLAKFVSTLKVSGLSVLKGVSHLTLNGTLYKTGDIIPLEVKGHTAYLQLVKITPDELTLGLNEERQVVRIRK
ncbi:MAG: hypothetical protein PSU94_03860 [Lacunisphaera sp.]|nr:hypothetical protein [Lacunisphaera sp.]